MTKQGRTKKVGLLAKIIVGAALFIIIGLGLAYVPASNFVHTTISYGSGKITATASPSSLEMGKMEIIDSTFSNNGVGIKTDNPAAFHIEGTTFDGNGKAIDTGH